MNEYDYSKTSEKMSMCLSPIKTITECAKGFENLFGDDGYNDHDRYHISISYLMSIRNAATYALRIFDVPEEVL